MRNPILQNQGIKPPSNPGYHNKPNLRPSHLALAPTSLTLLPRHSPPTLGRKLLRILPHMRTIRRVRAPHPIAKALIQGEPAALPLGGFADRPAEARTTADLAAAPAGAALGDRVVCLELVAQLGVFWWREA